MNLFGGSEPKKVAAPLASDKAVQEAAAEAARKRLSAKGFRSTILSRDFLPADAPVLKTTLGA